MLPTSAYITIIAAAICIINIVCLIENKREFNARQQLRDLKAKYPNMQKTLKEYEKEKAQKRKLENIDVICIGKAIYHNDKTVYWGSEKNENGPNVRLVYFLDAKNNFYTIINTHIHQTISQKDIDDKTVFTAVKRDGKIISVTLKDDKNTQK